jgi:hypothetical protein
MHTPANSFDRPILRRGPFFEIFRRWASAIKADMRVSIMPGAMTLTRIL